MQIQLHTDYSALMLTEREYIVSVQSIIRGTARQTFTKLTIKFLYINR